MEGVEYPSKPLQGVDAYDIATFDEGVEDGGVDGPVVVLAEEVVCPPHYRWSLIAFHRIDVNVTNRLFSFKLNFIFCAKISIQPIPGKAAFFGWLQTYKCILKEGR